MNKLYKYNNTFSSYKLIVLFLFACSQIIIPQFQLNSSPQEQKQEEKINENKTPVILQPHVLAQEVSTTFSKLQQRKASDYQALRAPYEQQIQYFAQREAELRETADTIIRSENYYINEIIRLHDTLTSNKLPEEQRVDVAKKLCYATEMAQYCNASLSSLVTNNFPPPQPNPPDSLWNKFKSLFKSEDTHSVVTIKSKTDSALLLEVTTYVPGKDYADTKYLAIHQKHEGMPLFEQTAHLAKQVKNNSAKQKLNTSAPQTEPVITTTPVSTPPRNDPVIKKSNQLPEQPQPKESILISSIPSKKNNGIVLTKSVTLLSNPKKPIRTIAKAQNIIVKPLQLSSHVIIKNNNPDNKPPKKFLFNNKNQVPSPSHNSSKITENKPDRSQAIEFMLDNCDINDPLFKEYQRNTIAAFHEALAILEHRHFLECLERSVDKTFKQGAPQGTTRKPVLQQPNAPFYYFSKQSKNEYTNKITLQNNAVLLFYDNMDALREKSKDYAQQAIIAKSYNNPLAYHVLARRVHALNQTIESPDLIKTKEFNITGRQKHFLKKVGFNPQEFSAYSGNPIQLVMHQEITELIDAIDTITHKYKIAALRPITYCAFELCGAAKAYNDSGNFNKTIETLDLGHQLVNFAKCYGKALAEGIFDGITNAAKDIGNTILHPIDTTIEILECFRDLTIATGQFLYRLSPPLGGDEKTWINYYQTLHDEKNWWTTLCDKTIQSIQSMSGEELTRSGIRIITEQLALTRATGALKKLSLFAKTELTTGKLGSQISKFADFSTDQLQSLTKKINNSKQLINSTIEKGWCSSETIHHVITNLESNYVGGCLNKLNQAYVNLKQLQALIMYSKQPLPMHKFLKIYQLLREAFMKSIPLLNCILKERKSLNSGKKQQRHSQHISEKLLQKHLNLIL